MNKMAMESYISVARFGYLSTPALIMTLSSFVPDFASALIFAAKLYNSKLRSIMVAWTHVYALTAGDVTLLNRTILRVLLSLNHSRKLFRVIWIAHCCDDPVSSLEKLLDELKADASGRTNDNPRLC